MKVKLKPSLYLAFLKCCWARQ